MLAPPAARRTGGSGGGFPGEDFFGDAVGAFVVDVDGEAAVAGDQRPKDDSEAAGEMAEHAFEGQQPRDVEEQGGEAERLHRPPLVLGELAAEAEALGRLERLRAAQPEQIAVRIGPAAKGVEAALTVRVGGENVLLL